MCVSAGLDQPSDEDEAQMSLEFAIKTGQFQGLPTYRLRFQPA
jgi:hypothetical protein